MKLYSGPLSLFTAKVRIALAEKQLAFDRIEVGWTLQDRYLPHHPDVVALNPKRQVPVLVDGDVVVTDSTRILEYLEDRSPTPPLFPDDPAGRARARRFEAWADEDLFPTVWTFIEEAFYPTEPGAEQAAAGRDTERLDAARGELAAHHALLDKELTDREWLAGDRFGVADIGAFVFLSAVATMGGAPDSGHGALLAWMQRSASRPSVATDMAEMVAFRASLDAS